MLLYPVDASETGRRRCERGVNVNLNRNGEESTQSEYLYLVAAGGMDWVGISTVRRRMTGWSKV